LIVVVALALGGRAMAEEEGVTQELRDWAKRTVEERAGKGAPAPEFPAGLSWLNVSRPLTVAGDLKGKVVVLDFWCYCCINCIHVLPDLEHLERKFEGKAFAVVGVHSAKFLNEKDTENIREAVLRYEIRHPVVNDGDFAVWERYGAHSWPTFAVIAPDGRLLGSLGGEGNRLELEALTEAALAHYGAKGLLDAKPLPVRLERKSRPARELAFPGKIVADAKRGSLFVADSNHNRVVELGLDGSFRRAFGDGERGLVDGDAATARFFRPQGLALRGDELWVADTENHAVRRVDLATGRVVTVAGDGVQGQQRGGSGKGSEVRLSSPWDLLFVGDVLHVAMAGNHQLWTIDPATGVVSHFAGSGQERREDSTSLRRAAFAQPSGLAHDGTWLYVADSESSSVVRVKLPDGPVETLAGANENPQDLFDFGDQDGAGHGAKFQHPLGLLFHRGVLYVADTYNHKIKSIDPGQGTVTTRWGDGAPALRDDPASFSEPAGLAALGDVLYVADTNNHAIRAIDLKTGKVSTLALKGVPLPQASARASGAGAWAEPAGTVRASLAPAKVAAGAPVTLRLALDLPLGWHLTEGAPSALRLEGAGEPVERSIAATTTSVELPPLRAGPATLTLRLLYYVCRDQGTCRMRSAVLSVPVEAGTAGPPAFDVSDAFRP
jgi:sugar lactone lactonase YvrE